MPSRPKTGTGGEGCDCEDEQRDGNPNGGLKLPFYGIYAMLDTRAEVHDYHHGEEQIDTDYQEEEIGRHHLRASPEILKDAEKEEIERGGDAHDQGCEKHAVRKYYIIAP